jgi:hypothetical protein
MLDPVFGFSSSRYDASLLNDSLIPQTNAPTMLVIPATIAVMISGFTTYLQI